MTEKLKPCPYCGAKQNQGIVIHGPDCPWETYNKIYDLRKAAEIARLRREVFEAQMRAQIAHEALTTIRDGSVNMGVEEFANLCMDIAAEALKEMDGE